MQLSEALRNGNFAVPAISGTPAGNGDFNGQFIMQIGPNDRRGAWRWDAVAEAWDYFPCGAIFGSGDPNGFFVADGLMQEYFNQADNSLWFWNGSAWIKTTATP